MQDDVEVKERERQFHDQRFKQDVDPRKQLSKYYAITSASNDLFKQLVTERLRPGGSLLEYGCGTGGDFALYKALGCRLHGVDISAEAVAKANERARSQGLEATYVVGDAESTGFDADQFDVVVGAGILHHLDLDRSLSELARITRRDGVCVFSEPLGHNPLINLFRRATPAMRTPDEHPLLDSDLRLMGKYFGDVWVRYFYLSSLLAVPFRKTSLFEPVYRTLLGVDEKLFRAWPGLARHAWICIIALSRPVKPAAA